MIFSKHFFVFKIKHLFLFFLIPIALFCLASEALAAPTFQPWSENVFAHVEKEYGKEAAKRIRYVHDIALKNQDIPVVEKLQLVNDTMNNLPWIADEKHWKQADYWASPMETIATFGGDCEDIAIAKWMMLRFLGIPRDKLRLSYVKVKATGENHMVLAYVDNIDIPREERLAFTWVLDNLDTRLLKAEERKDLLAIYATDAEGNVVFIKDTGKDRSILDVRKNVTMSKLEEMKEKTEKELKRYQEINDGRPLLP